jgi:hypothetical protein
MPNRNVNHYNLLLSSVYCFCRSLTPTNRLLFISSFYWVHRTFTIFVQHFIIFINRASILASERVLFLSGDYYFFFYSYWIIL